MRKVYLGCLLMALGLGLVGCPLQPVALVGTTWWVDVRDTTGAVSPWDDGDTLGDLSGEWYFYSDNTFEIYSDFEGDMFGTYTTDGSTVNYTLDYDDSEDLESYQWEWHVSITGSLTEDQTSGTLQGTGTYEVAYSDSRVPDDNYSLSGACTVDGIVATDLPVWLWTWLVYFFPEIAGLI